MATETIAGFINHSTMSADKRANSEQKIGKDNQILQGHTKEVLDELIELSFIAMYDQYIISITSPDGIEEDVDLYSDDKARYLDPPYDEIQAN